MSNYPDDAHQYTNDSRSPFYDDGGFDDAVERKTEDVKADLKDYFLNGAPDKSSPSDNPLPSDHDWVSDMMKRDHGLNFDFYEWLADNADELAERITAEYHDSIVYNLMKGD